MCVWIGFHSLIKGLENQQIVIAFAEHIGHDAPIAKVEYGTQIELLYLHTLKPPEFGHIGEPLFIGLCGIKLPVQKVFGKILRVLRSPRAAMVVVLDRETDISGPADAEHPLVIDVDTVVMTQVVIKSPVALIRTFLMDLLNRIRKTLIFCSPLAQLSRGPFVVGRARHMEQFTGQLNGIPFSRELPGSRHRYGAVSLPKGISPFDLVQFF